MKRVVSVSLFLGNQASRDATDPFYYDFVRPWVRAHHNCFPEWELRIHHDGEDAETRRRGDAETMGPRCGDWRCTRRRAAGRRPCRS
jgi:hypothetical protein